MALLLVEPVDPIRHRHPRQRPAEPLIPPPQERAIVKPPQKPKRRPKAPAKRQAKSAGKPAVQRRKPSAPTRPPQPKSAVDVKIAATLELVRRALDDDKAEDIAVIDLRGLTSIADHMVVATGRSQRHVGALAERLAQKVREATGRSPRVEGLPQCDWVLIDAGDIIVHVFRPEVRDHYSLEKMWSRDFAQPRED